MSDRIERVARMARSGLAEAGEQDIASIAELFLGMSRSQRRALLDRTARGLMDAPRDVQDRHIAACTRASSAYGAGVARRLGFLAIGGAV